MRAQILAPAQKALLGLVGGEIVLAVPSLTVEFFGLEGHGVATPTFSFNERNGVICRFFRACLNYVGLQTVRRAFVQNPESQSTRQHPRKYA
jgi:hypothetical protein